MQSSRAVQTNVTGGGPVVILPAPSDPKVYHDLLSLVITTTNTTPATLTISDGTKTVLVLNYPNAALAPQPLVVTLPVPARQSAPNAAWTLTASANANGLNVTAQYSERL